MLPLFALLLPFVAAQTCTNFGEPSGSSCLCPPGFNAAGSDGSCTLPVCGGSLYTPEPVAPGGTGGYGNISAGNCGCADGWGGPGCTVCSSGASCSSSLSRYLDSSDALSSGNLNTSLTCSTIPTVYSSSHLSCSVIQPTLQALFPLASTLTITRSLNASLTPGGSATLTSAGLASGDGLVFAQVWYDGTEQFYCKATGCTQTVTPANGGVNGSTWTCPTLGCECRNGTDFCGGGRASTSQNLTGTIQLLKGPLTIDCSSQNTCSFKQTLLQGLFGVNGLELSSCSFGECVEQYVVDQALGVTAAVATGNGLSGGVIAGLAVVGAILLAILGVTVWGFLARRRARRDMRTDGQMPKSGRVGIRWSGVGYEVKPTSSNTFTKTAAWMRGSSAGAARQAEDGAALGPGGGKIVLRDAGGSLPPGGLCCILGPSGAGKSTLVDIIAGKRKAGRVEGRVSFVREGSEGRVRVGYVDQSDVLSPTSTVYETLLFATKLRLPENIPQAFKERRARTVMSQLGLDHVADTRVGSVEYRGISGGEMRRVSIGVELVAAPDILVLDEPTSGLDSVSAARLVKLLRGLTEDEETRTTIVASIHQPSSALYHSFSQVVLLAEGRQLYFGPGGNKPAEFFASQGRPCPAGYNVADHLLEIASAPLDGLLSGPDAVLASSPDGVTGSTSSSDSKDSFERRYTAEHGDTPFTEKGRASPSYPPQLPKGTVGHEVDLADDGAKERTGWWPRTHCATTFLTQIEVLSGREWRNLRRDKTLLIAHLAIACVVGVFAGGLYFKVSLTIAGFQNRVGSLFFLGSLVAFSSLRYVFMRPRPSLIPQCAVQPGGGARTVPTRAGWLVLFFYRPQAWLLSRVLFDVIPLRLIPTIIVGVIVYFMVGLASDAARFFKFLLILVEYSLGMTLFNFLLACVVRNGGVAILLSSLCNLFLMTYAGFFVNISQIPPVLRWLRYFSTLGYTLEALSINEVGSGLMIIDVLDGVNIEISATLIMETLFGFSLGNYYRDVLVLFAYIAGYTVLLIGTVVYLLRERR